MLKRLIINFILITVFWANVVFAAHEKTAPPVFVETITVKPAAKMDQISSTGTLVSIPGIIVKPEISGRVTKIYFKSGEFVTKDTALIEINPDILKAELAAAQADLKLNKLNFERSSALYKTHDISKSDFDLAQANYNSAKANIAGMAAKLQQALVRAPFDGKLGLSQVNVGEYISAGQNTVSLQTVNPLKVDFSIPELYQSKVAVGQTVLLHADAYPKETFVGKVEALESLINQNNRTLSLRANVPNNEGKLIPGGFVTVTLQFTAQQAITIPQTSVVYAPDGCYVFKVIGDKAEKTKVILGAKDSDNVTVKSGLKSGDIVITAGQIKILSPETHVVVAGSKKS